MPAVPIVPSCAYPGDLGFTFADREANLYPRAAPGDDVEDECDQRDDE
jgi:hypothetical protein